MFIVTVTFSIKPGKTGQFMPPMLQQASQSLALEASCRQFDVCVDHANEHRVFLYERYDDQLSFEAHLASDHYVAFSKNVGDLILEKQVEFWNQTEQAT